MTSHEWIKRGTAAVSGLVAVLAGIAAAFGVFARGDGTFATVVSARGEVYEMATTGVYAHNARQLVAEGVGWDVFTLAVAAPALLGAAVLVARGSVRATLGAAGLLGYFFYMHLEYAVTWAFGPLFLVFVLTYAASLLGLLGSAALVGAARAQHGYGDAFPRRRWAALSIGMASALSFLWVGRIADGLSTATPALHGETTMTIQALDLGLVVPVSVLTAILALRRSPIGYAASTVFGVTFVTMSAAIASMMVSSALATGVLELAPIVVFSAAAVLGAFLVRRMFGSLSPTPDRDPHRTSSSALAAGISVRTS